MVDDIVRSEAHTEEGTSWVEMTGHTCTTVDILTNTLEWGRGREIERGREREREREKGRQIDSERI